MGNTSKLDSSRLAAIKKTPMPWKKCVPFGVHQGITPFALDRIRAEFL
ncbi:MAG: hypothetical protein LBE51_21325 [Acidovorax sp.]|jgi:hypothetical protein|nr:hypothetical protein [Acidovorax sp.]